MIEPMITTESIPETNFMPPAPPSNNVESGNFDYIDSNHEKEMLSSAFHAIHLTENWEFMKRPIESYQFSENDELKQIMNQITKLGYHGHSGFSFGWTMRQMQYIAIHGEKAYMELRLTK